MAEGSRRPAWLEIDLDAIEHNAAVLAAIAAPARLCAVVKADAYGHGAVEVAAAALAGGASCLAVAIVDEGVELRDAGIEAPLLVLSEPGADAMAEVYAYGLVPTIYTPGGLSLTRDAARAHVGRRPGRTGAHRSRSRSTRACTASVPTQRHSCRSPERSSKLPSWNSPASGPISPWQTSRRAK